MGCKSPFWPSCVGWATQPELGPEFMSIVTANGPSMSMEVTGGSVPPLDPEPSSPPSLALASDPLEDLEPGLVGEAPPPALPLPDGGPLLLADPLGGGPESSVAVAAGLGASPPNGRPSLPPLAQPRPRTVATSENQRQDLHFSFMSVPVHSIHEQQKNMTKRWLSADTIRVSP
jgi:hypothetical protein